MYTFLFLSDPNAERLERRLEHSARITTELIPALGAGLRITFGYVPEAEAGWMIIAPERDRQRLITSHVDDKVAALVFGEVGGDNSARQLAEAFCVGGVAQAQRLPGEYCAVVIDKVLGQTFLISDVIGRRSAQYFTHENVLAISPHSVTLAATGLCPLDIDWVSAASILGAEFSLDGRPLNSNLAVQQPWEVLEWQRGRLERRVAPHLVFTDRVDRRDTQGIESRLAAIEAHMLTNTKKRANAHATIRCSLTAGMDSRAVFALLIRCFEPSKIQTFTVGGPDNVDVVVGKQIASMLGSPHTRVEQESPGVAGFEDNLRLWAFHMNGDVNAKRALAPLVFDPDQDWVANGVGGEVFRGYFYKFFGPLGRVPDRLDEIERIMIARSFRRLGSTPFADDGLRDGVRVRVRAILERYADWSPNGYDIVDRFYLLNRYARWGAITARCVWSPSWTPYSDPNAIVEAYRLPAPIATHCPIHTRLIRNHLPAEVFEIPVNGGLSLRTEGIGRINYLRRQLAGVRAKLVDRARQRRQASSRSIETLRAELLAGPLYAPMHDALTSPSSVAEQLLGRARTEALLDEHRSRSNHLEVLGSMLSMDAWRDLYGLAHRRGSAAELGNAC
jgi:hypothetical protein